MRSGAAVRALCCGARSCCCSASSSSAAKLQKQKQQFALLPGGRTLLLWVLAYTREAQLSVRLAEQGLLLQSKREQCGRSCSKTAALLRTPASRKTKDSSKALHSLKSKQSKVHSLMAPTTQAIANRKAAKQQAAREKKKLAPASACFRLPSYLLLLFCVRFSPLAEQDCFSCFAISASASRFSLLLRRPLQSKE